MIRLGIHAIVLTTALLVGISGPLRSVAAASESGSAFLMELRDKAIHQLADAEISEQEREQRFQDLLRSNFNLLAIGRFVLGTYWRNADESARAEFLAAFEGYIVQRFMPVFAAYQGQKIEIGESGDRENGGQMSSVDSRIMRGDGEPIPVTWRLQKTDEGYRIVDIVTAGVSMAITLRSEFASMLRDNGGDLRVAAQALRSKLIQRSDGDKQEG